MKKREKNKRKFFEVRVLKGYTLEIQAWIWQTLSFLGTKSVDAQFRNEQIVDLKELPKNSV